MTNILEYNEPDNGEDEWEYIDDGNWPGNPALLVLNNMIALSVGVEKMTDAKIGEALYLASSDMAMDTPFYALLTEAAKRLGYEPEIEDEQEASN